MSKELLTDHEIKVIHALAKAWNEYLLLPDFPPDDIQDFMAAIHTAQRIVLTRPGLRQMGGNGPILLELQLEELKQLATSREKEHAFTTETISRLLRPPT